MTSESATNDERPTTYDERSGRLPEHNFNAAVYGQRLGHPQSSGQGTGAGAGPDQRHHAGHGVDDRLRHLHRVGRNRPRSGFPGVADRRLGGGWIHDHRGRAQLRRVGRHDAAGRRPIRLSARGAGAVVGISLRLDFIPGDSDRNHRRRGRGLRQVSGRFLAIDFFDALAVAHLEGSAHSRRAHGAGQHGRRNQYPEPDGDPAGDFPFGGEYLRLEDGRGDSEHLHRGQSFRAAGIGGIRFRAWPKRAALWPRISAPTSGTTPD